MGCADLGRHGCGGAVGGLVGGRWDGEPLASSWPAPPTGCGFRLFDGHSWLGLGRGACSSPLGHARNGRVKGSFTGPAVTV